MEHIILFIFLSFWITQTISTEYIFQPIRLLLSNNLLGKLISCPYCLGTWTGALLAIPIHLLSFHWSINILFGAALSYTIQKIFDIFDNTPKLF